VIEQPFMSFTLVPQTDRRQEADRRGLWRGGRRASDAMTREQATAKVQTDPTAFWGASQRDLRPNAEKLRLH
jgi:hypothetical protein